MGPSVINIAGRNISVQQQYQNVLLLLMKSIRGFKIGRTYSLCDRFSDQRWYRPVSCINEMAFVNALVKVIITKRFVVLLRLLSANKHARCILQKCGIMVSEVNIPIGTNGLSFFKLIFIRPHTCAFPLIWQKG